LGLAAVLSAGALLSAAVLAADAAVGAVKDVLLSRLVASLAGLGAIDVLDDAVAAGFADPTAGFAVVGEDFAARGFFVATDDFTPFCDFETDAARRRSSDLLGRAAPPLTAAASLGSAGLTVPGSSALEIGLSGFVGCSVVSCCPTAWSFSSAVVDMAAATGKKFERTLLRGLLSSPSRPASPGDLPLGSRELSAALFSNIDRRLRTADEDRSGDISIMAG
jgi:hypothetical protein